jgi:aminoglycoside phosphotransferase (APT) family kinase protein
VSGGWAAAAEEQARPLPTAGVDRVISELWPGGSLVSVERIVGGLGAGMHRLDVVDAGGRADAVVLRTFLAAWGHGPELAEREHATLAALAAAGVPVPAPRWLDVEGDVLGRPALAMEVVPGRPVVSSRPPDGAVLGRALAAVHAVPPAAVPHLPPAPVLADQVLRALPSDERVADGFVEPGRVWRALDAWLGATPEPAPATLFHGDFHAGNVLSDGDRVTVVDWTWACLGDPGRDLAYCRYDLALANGPEAAEAFTSAYRAAGGPAVPSAGWDLVAVASSLPTPAEWLRGFVELGRDDLSAELFEARGGAYLAGVLDRLGPTEPGGARRYPPREEDRSEETR